MLNTFDCPAPLSQEDDKACQEQLEALIKGQYFRAYVEEGYYVTRKDSYTITLIPSGNCFIVDVNTGVTLSEKSRFAAWAFCNYLKTHQCGPFCDFYACEKGETCAQTFSWLPGQEVHLTWSGLTQSWEADDLKQNTVAILNESVDILADLCVGKIEFYEAIGTAMTKELERIFLKFKVSKFTEQLDELC